MIRKEWKNLFKNKILLASICVLFFVPAIYSSIFLGAAWDPYGKTENLPVAVVNKDKSYEYEGKNLNIGNDLVENLKDNNNFKWSFVDQSNAEEGLENGRYYMIIEIPSDISKNVSTLLTDNPKKLELVYKTNPSRSMTGQLITKQGALSIENQIKSTITKQYSESIFDQLKYLGDGLSKAAKGSLELNNGTLKLSDGNNEITTNLNALTQSTNDFSKGVSDLKNGISSAGDGVGKLKQGSGNLYNGLKTYTDGVSQLNLSLSQVNSIISQNPEMPESQQLQLYKKAFAGLNQGVSKLDSSSDDLLQGVGSLNEGLKNLDTNMPKLVEGADTLKVGSNKISDGAQKLANGSKELGSGIKQLEDGSKELETSLGDGAEKVSNVNANENTYDMFANPTDLKDNSITKLSNYGQGLAGYMLPLGLFVGAIAFNFIFSLSKPSEEVESTFKWWLSKFSIMLAFGVINALLLDTVMIKVLNLQFDNLNKLIIVSVITSILFISLVSLLVTSLGQAGSLLSAILLVLQISSSGGIFPLELTNKFYQTISRYLPMTYSVRGFREALSGGFTISQFNNSVLVLLGFVVLLNLLIVVTLKFKKIRVSEI